MCNGVVSTPQRRLFDRNHQEIELTGQERKLDTIFGFKTDHWDMAREQAREALIRSARAESPVYYSDLTAQINAIHLDLDTEKDRAALGRLLGEISTESDAEGKGMLSALAVSKDAYTPTYGFFNLAKELGYDVDDKTEFWIAQYNKVITTWRA